MNAKRALLVVVFLVSVAAVGFFVLDIGPDPQAGASSPGLDESTITDKSAVAKNHNRVVLEQGFTLSQEREENNGEREASALQVVEYNAETGIMHENTVASNGFELNEYHDINEGVSHTRSFAPGEGESFSLNSRAGDPEKYGEQLIASRLRGLELQASGETRTVGQADTRIYDVVGISSDAPDAENLTNEIDVSGEIAIDEDGVVRLYEIQSTGFSSNRSYAERLTVSAPPSEPIAEPSWVPCTTVSEIVGYCYTTDGGVPALYDAEGELVPFVAEDWDVNRNEYFGDEVVTVGTEEDRNAGN